MVTRMFVTANLYLLPNSSNRKQGIFKRRIIYGHLKVQILNSVSKTNSINAQQLVSVKTTVQNISTCCEANSTNDL